MNARGVFKDKLQDNLCEVATTLGKGFYVSVALTLFFSSLFITSGFIRSCETADWGFSFFVGQQNSDLLNKIILLHKRVEIISLRCSLGDSYTT